MQLSKCVALEPCGHNFCATCLSHHLGSQLEGGLQLACPFRCPPPERIVVNYAVRALVDLLAGGGGGRGSRGRGGGGSAAGSPERGAAARGACAAAAAAGASPLSGGGGARWGAAAARSSASPSPSPSGSSLSRPRGGAAPRAPGDDDGDGDGDDFYTQGMSVLCPLGDDELPLDAAGLKGRQVDAALRQLLDPDAGAAARLAGLESLARLAWSDDGVREAAAAGGGARGVVAALEAHPGDDGVACNACLALMALVRGESEVCQVRGEGGWLFVVGEDRTAGRGGGGAGGCTTDRHAPTLVCVPLSCTQST